jgi:hypothetical protein
MAYDDDRGIAAFLDDLERQAQGAWAAERDLEVAERARAEYARVGLAGRLMAGIDEQVALQVTGVGAITGEVSRVAEGWLLVTDGSVEWIVLLDAVETVRGLPARSVPPEAWPVTARLGSSRHRRRTVRRKRLRDRAGRSAGQVASASNGGVSPSVSGRRPSRAAARRLGVVRASPR